MSARMKELEHKRTDLLCQYGLWTRSSIPAAQCRLQAAYYDTKSRFVFCAFHADSIARVEDNK